MKYFKSEKSFWLYVGGMGLILLFLLLLKVFLNWSFASFLLVAVIVIGLSSFRPISYQVKKMKE
ncbi:hypothetical protein C7H83_06320 [Tetragenococcus halophilus]|uniref:Uncharacterized protein n=1 Tax=Tetragenococcus halophilus TaxID=51669 RepID=A0A3G5FIF5_TETHA|nr:hypothetical protein AC806_03740 [Tetragenococcus halophilus]AYW50100.1 hypothetical protein C7H83_06320 [Tetragenococcus halophilus]GEQ42443.1 hypothetical protein TH6N_10690 [Tetragenococcus halophilus]GEQ44690.1 hypothetical protein TH8N_10600 [Tetragenococcus halophilus]GEQ46948.1 hypothetical protein TH9N_10610 [Tetragenococcus halophilus]